MGGILFLHGADRAASPVLRREGVRRPGLLLGDESQFGQLGIGNNTGAETVEKLRPHSSKPVAVAGSLKFRRESRQRAHLRRDHRQPGVLLGPQPVWPGGRQSAGWLKFRPVRVAGTQQYRQVDAGGNLPAP